jgi:hypothetical protein
MAVLAVTALGAAAVSVAAFLTGDPVTGVSFAAGAVFVGHVVGFGAAAARRRGRPGHNATLVPSPDGTTKGVRYRYAAGPYYWLTALLVMVELILLLLIAGATASGTVVGIAAAVVFAALAVPVAAFLVTMLRLARGEVAVSPAGVFHRGLTHMHFVPWYAVTAVEAHWLGTPAIAVQAYPSEDTGVRRYLGRFDTAELRYLPFMVIHTHWLATDPATVYHILSFYQANPDRRPELATPIALDRVRDGRVVARNGP